MNIAVFSGSFNPIHAGHLILANYVSQFTGIHEVWFLVSPCNPFKTDENLLDEKIRFEMVQLALQDYPLFKASDFEFHLPKPSYTINTLDALKKSYPEHDFTLIIGSDNWTEFDKWRNYDKILDNYSIKIYPRLGYRISIPPKYKSRVEALDAPIVEISSTFIRESISEGKEMKAFLPEAVYQYINSKELYR